MCITAFQFFNYHKKYDFENKTGRKTFRLLTTVISAFQSSPKQVFCSKGPATCCALLRAWPLFQFKTKAYFNWLSYLRANFNSYKQYAVGLQTRSFEITSIRSNANMVSNSETIKYWYFRCSIHAVISHFHS